MLSRRTRIVLAVLVVTALTFIILDLRGGEGPLTGVRNLASNARGGLERVAATVFSPITNGNAWWSTMRDQANQIENLTKENNRLRGESETFANDRARVAALDGLLRVANVGQYRFVPAEVIAGGPAQDFSWTITIDAGKNDGIEQDMTVINGDGLVGRILKTTANTSTVVLIVDASSAVGGRVAGSEEIGIVSGTGRQDSLEFQLLDPLADLRVGDALVTFGSKGGRAGAFQRQLCHRQSSRNPRGAMRDFTRGKRSGSHCNRSGGLFHARDDRVRAEILQRKAFAVAVGHDHHRAPGRARRLHVVQRVAHHQRLGGRGAELARRVEHRVRVRLLALHGFPGNHHAEETPQPGELEERLREPARLVRDAPHRDSRAL